MSLLFCVIPAACPWYSCDQFPADGVVKSEVVWSTCLVDRTAQQPSSWTKDSSLPILWGLFLRMSVSFCSKPQNLLALSFFGGRVWAVCKSDGSVLTSLTPVFYPGTAMCSGEFVSIRLCAQAKSTLETVLSRASERLKMFGVKHCFKRFLIQSVPTVRLGNLRPREVTWLVFYFLSNWLKQKARPGSSEYWGFICLFFPGTFSVPEALGWAHPASFGEGKKEKFVWGGHDITVFIPNIFFWARKQLNLTTIDKCLLFMD